MTMNMAVQAAPPTRPPASPEKKPVSPHKKLRPSMSLMPTTPRSSRLAISNFSNTYPGFSDKNALFQSFSELSLDNVFDKEEEEQQEPQKQHFMASLVDFLDDDEFFGDSEFKKMCTERQASADNVAGGTKEEVDFNTNLASLFSYFNDLLTSKRAFDKKECSTLQQEMERLKKMRRRMTMAAEYKLDASGFPRAPPHNPTACSRKQPTHEGDAVQLQLEEQKRGTESRGDPVTPPNRSSEFEYGGEPVTSRSRSPTRRSEGTHRSPKSPSRRLHKSNDNDDINIGKPRGTSLMLSPRRPINQRDPLGASSWHSRSPRKRSGLGATLQTPSSRKGDGMSLGVSSNTSRSMSASISPRKSTRTSGQDYGLAAILHTSSLRKGESMSLFSVSSHTSRSMPVPMSPRKSTRTSGQDYGLDATLHTTSPRKRDSMSLPCVSSHTSRSMSVPVSPRKSTRTSGQSDPVRSPTTPRRLRSRASSPVKSPRKFLQMDPLGVSESVRLPITPRRLRSRALSPMKSPRKFLQMDPLGVSGSIRLPITPRRLRSRALSPVKMKSPWEFLQKDPLGVSESTPAPITPTKLRSGAYSPVKSPRLSRKDPRGVSESIRAVQLHGTPRRYTKKSSTGHTSAKPEHIPFSIHHIARLNDRSGSLDSPKTDSLKSSRGARPRAQSQATTTTLSNHEMFSNRETLMFKLSL